MIGILPVSLVLSLATPLEGRTAAIGLLSGLQVGHAASHLKAESTQPLDSCSVFRIHLKYHSVYCVGVPGYVSIAHHLSHEVHYTCYFLCKVKLSYEVTDA